jgi:hypothetical protein
VGAKGGEKGKGGSDLFFSTFFFLLKTHPPSRFENHKQDESERTKTHNMR